MTTRKPTRPFDFNQAVGQVFLTSDGREFGLRLWFWVTAVITIAYLIVIPIVAPSYGLMLELNWQNMQAVLSGQAPTDYSDEILSINPFVWATYIFLTFAVWGGLMAGETALYRKIFYNIEAPRMPLRWGAQEWRTLGAQLLVWIGVFFIYMLGIILLITLAVMGGVAMSALLVIIFIPFYICLLIIFPIRMAPASALSMKNNRFEFIRARDVTKGRFWNLCLAALVIIIGGYIATMLVTMITMWIISGDSDFMLKLSGFGDENPAVLFDSLSERLRNPLIMAMAILGLIVNVACVSLWMLSLSGLWAYAVNWWSEDAANES